jgi:hypothetical protein
VLSGLLCNLSSTFVPSYNIIEVRTKCPIKRGDFQYIPILSLRATGRKDVLLRHGRMHWTDARLHLFFLDIYLARWHGGVDLQKKWWCSHHKVKWVKCPILGIISSKTISDVYFCWFVRQRLPDKFPLLLTAPLSKDGVGAQGMHRFAVCDLLTHTHTHMYIILYIDVLDYTRVYSICMWLCANICAYNII